MIRTPSINLARRPFRNNTAYYAVFGICFAFLAAASGYNVYDFIHEDDDLARLHEELAARTQRYQGLGDEVEKMKTEVARLDLTTLNTKSNFANGLILSKLFSWSTLFDRIEDIMPQDVKIRSIRPAISPKAIEIQIDGLARTPEALYEFEAALDGSDWFSGVYPVSESTRETRAEINFDLSMNYIPAGKTTLAPGTPASPTAGLPQPETTADAAAPETVAPAVAPEAAESASSDEESATSAPAMTPGESVVNPPAAGPAPAGTASRTAAPIPAAPGAVPAAGEAITSTDALTSTPAEAAGARFGKAPRLMTNKELLDTFGLDRLMRMRGRWTAKSGPEADLTNDEYVKKYGTDAFIKARGDLTVDMQNVTGRPAGSAPGGGTP